MKRASMANAAPSTSLVVENDRGSLFASLRYARFKRRGLEFALTVVNTRDKPLLATTYALKSDGSEVQLPSFAFWIDARTEAYVNVPLALAAALRSRTLVVRIRGQGIDERVESPIPQPYALVFVTAALLVVAAVLVVMLLRPTLAFLNVDRNGIANGTISAQYEFRGNGRGVWELTEIDGRHVDGGELSSLAGTLSVHLPAANAQKIYLLRLRADGGLGSASADRVIVARVQDGDQRKRDTRPR